MNSPPTAVPDLFGEGGGGAAQLKNQSERLLHNPDCSYLPLVVRSQVTSPSAMPPPKRKRSGSARRDRGNRADHVDRDDRVEPAPKRRPPAEDEDILSDDADDTPFASAAPSSPKSDSQDSLHVEPPNETAEEKRLRLARAYLRHVGISEDAALASDDDDDRARSRGGPGEDESDAADVADSREGGLLDGNELLRRQALLQTGKEVTKVAADFAAALPRATVARGKGHVQAPTCVALCKGGDETAVSGGKDSRVIVWDVQTQQRRVVFKPTLQSGVRPVASKANGHVKQVLCVDVSDDGNIVASGGMDGLVRVWDVRSGKLVESMRGHRGSVNGVAFRTGTRQLFSASKDRTVKIWDMNDIAYVETLFGHGCEVNAVDSLVLERALSCGRDGTLRLFKVVEGSQLVFKRSQTVSIDAVAMLSEQRFISGGDDGALCLWQTNKKRPTAVVENAHGDGLGCEAWVSSLCASRNTDLAVSGGGDGHLRFWRCEEVTSMGRECALELGPGFINGIALGQKHGLMAVASGDEQRLGRWARIRGAKNSLQFVSIPDIS